MCKHDSYLRVERGGCINGNISYVRVVRYKQYGLFIGKLRIVLFKKRIK